MSDNNKATANPWFPAPAPAAVPMVPRGANPWFPAPAPAAVPMVPRGRPPMSIHFPHHLCHPPVNPNQTHVPHPSHPPPPPPLPCPPHHCAHNGAMPSICSPISLEKFDLETELRQPGALGALMENNGCKSGIFFKEGSSAERNRAAQALGVRPLTSGVQVLDCGECKFESLRLVKEFACRPLERQASGAAGDVRGEGGEGIDIDADYVPLGYGGSGSGSGSGSGAVDADTDADDAANNDYGCEILCREHRELKVPLHVHFMPDHPQSGKQLQLKGVQVYSYDSDVGSQTKPPIGDRVVENGIGALSYQDSVQEALSAAGLDSDAIDAAGSFKPTHDPNATSRPFVRVRAADLSTDVHGSMSRVDTPSRGNEFSQTSGPGIRTKADGCMDLELTVCLPIVPPAPSPSPTPDAAADNAHGGANGAAAASATNSTSGIGRPRGPLSIEFILVFEFEIHERVGAFAFSQVTVFSGLCARLRVAGMPRKELTVFSAEAKAFLPHALRIFFDAHCPVFSFTANADGCVSSGFRSLRFYLYVAKHASSINSPSPQLLLEYDQHLKSRTLSRLLQEIEGKCSDAVKSRVAAAEQADINFLQAAVHILRLDSFLYLEELQMRTDIVEYDIHNFSMDIIQVPSDQNKGANSFVATFRVKGSAESRPKVFIGMKLRLRLDLPNNATVELAGVVLRFTLKTEEVMCEFVAPVLAHLGIDDCDLGALIQSRACHLRFSFERCGFSFMHVALRSVLGRYEICGQTVRDLFAADLLSGINFKTDRFLNYPLMQLLFPEQETVDLIEKHLVNLLLKEVQIGCADSLPLADMGRLNGRVGSATTEGGSANAEQLLAIHRITSLVKLSDSLVEKDSAQGKGDTRIALPPFVIFGPPGTGKTATIINAIISIASTYPAKKILACAPSDTAADVICSRLLKHFKSVGMTHQAIQAKLLRLNWWQRVPESVPAELTSLCYFSTNSSGIEHISDFPKNLMSFQIVVATCGAAGAIFCDQSRVNGSGTRIRERGLFDVVVVDEASQALEAEAISAIIPCKRSGGVVVLAGDVNQLGPTVRSPLAKVAKLSSLQERLMEYPFYANCMLKPDAAAKRSGSSTSSAAASATGYGTGEGGFSMGVFLTKNYRSHRDILTLPSELFYNGALEQCGAVGVIESMRRFRYVPRQVAATSPDACPLQFQTGDCAIRFVGVNGTHAHEIDSPSFFNSKEVATVVDVCVQVMQYFSKEKLPITAADIGVIAAFRQQVLKIRIELRKMGLGEISVGSVEDFQGQEFRVVVISTVLTNTEWLHRQGNGASSSSLAAAGGSQQNADKPMPAVGLLNDARKFNVAVTRAMSLSVVVGHPELLYSSDNLWKLYIKYCRLNGTFIGESCEAVEAFAERGGTQFSPPGAVDAVGVRDLVQDVVNDIGTGGGKDGTKALPFHPIGKFNKSDAFDWLLGDGITEEGLQASKKKGTQAPAPNPENRRKIEDLMRHSYMGDLEWRNML